MQESLNNGDLLDVDKQHIIGDSAFELKPWLMTPYKKRDSRSPSHEIFNRKLSGTRYIVEKAYDGDLKNRLCRLLDIDVSIERCVH